MSVIFLSFVFIFPLSLFVLAWIKDATLTALSTSSVNIAFVGGNGHHPSLWEVQREDWSIACSVRDNAPLRDCTENRARLGRNLFRIGGQSAIANWVPKSAYKSTLTTNRKCFFSHQFILGGYSLFLCPCFVCILASEGLTLVYRSPTRVVVRFVPTYNIEEYSIVARNTEVGPFQGTCDASTYICDITNLRPASVYILWLRTCKRSGFLYCDLLAIPFEVTTFPEGK